MKHLLLLSFLLLLILAPEARAADEVHRLETGDGRTAVLFDDGSWSYLSDLDTEAASSSSMVTASDRHDIVSVTYDNSVWTRFPNPRQLSPDASVPRHSY